MLIKIVDGIATIYCSDCSEKIMALPEEMIVPLLSKRLDETEIKLEVPGLIEKA